MAIKLEQYCRDPKVINGGVEREGEKKHCVKRGFDNRDNGAGANHSWSLNSAGRWRPIVSNTSFTGSALQSLVQFMVSLCQRLQGPFKSRWNILKVVKQSALVCSLLFKRYELNKKQNNNNNKSLFVCIYTNQAVKT